MPLFRGEAPQHDLLLALDHQALQQLLPQLDASLIQQQVKPCLLRLAEDSDKDVRYFAGQGLQSC